MQYNSQEILNSQQTTQILQYLSEYDLYLTIIGKFLLLLEHTFPALLRYTWKIKIACIRVYKAVFWYTLENQGN